MNDNQPLTFLPRSLRTITVQYKGRMATAMMANADNAFKRDENTEGLEVHLESGHLDWTGLYLSYRCKPDSEDSFEFACDSLRKAGWNVSMCYTVNK